jgi:hypothetical protein
MLQVESLLSKATFVARSFYEPTVGLILATESPHRRRADEHVILDARSLLQLAKTVLADVTRSAFW